MRNPERIDVFCAELARIWKTHCPDWRFGQLIMNVIGGDPFYWEEGKFLEEVRNYFHEPITDSRCIACGESFDCWRSDGPCSFRAAYGKCTTDCQSFNTCSNCIHGEF